MRLIEKIKSNKYGRLISNTLVFAVGKFASKLMVLLLMPLYTSILSTEEYGVADLITQTANLLIPIFCVGLCEAIFRFAIDSGDKKKVFSTALCVIFAGSVLLGVASPILSLIGLFDGYVWLICVFVICSNLHSACAQYLRAIGKVGVFATQGIINTALTIIYNVTFLVAFDMGVTGYVLSTVAADLTVTLGLFVFCKLYRDFSFKNYDKKTLRDMLKFSIPYIPTTLLWLITSVSDRFIVTYYCGEAANGLYSASYKIPTLITIVYGIFIEAWQISAVRDGGESIEEKEKFFGRVYRDYLAILVAGASFIILGSQVFTNILLADSYFESWRFVPILTVATMFSAFSSFLGSVYFLEKKSVYSMLTALTGALVNIVLNFVMIPKHGAMGAAVATLISYVTVYAVRVIDTRKYVKFNTHNIKLVINTVLLLVQSLVLLSEKRFSVLLAAALFFFIAVINLKGIVASFVKILNVFLKKSKNN
ncbi:MAG: oligosaccharide flippase family protein [Clostridia bacterium]|nr:oligosaccharide flippase family protein [Clostridia bacterium]